jgi:glutamate/tyrosine decarboxylase-like PLP-dependent enzyme
MTDSSLFLPGVDARKDNWLLIGEAIDQYWNELPDSPVSAALEPSQYRDLAESFDFSVAMPLPELISRVMTDIVPHQVHTGHPRYFGLFNPQLAAWSHAPMAAEIERHVVRSIGNKFGLADCDGTFTSGGAEANHTAILCALVARFPDFSQNGLRSLPAQPVLYVSSQSHHSFVKAARFSGLGTAAVRVVPCDESFGMDVAALESMIKSDTEAGLIPFMAVATGGTTNAGIIENIPEVLRLSRQFGLWCHVDAAWGGLAVLAPETAEYLAGTDQADSITFDAHKSMCVPMAAGMFLTPHKSILSETCRISTDYMPVAEQDQVTADPYTHSMQWSRRFIGLKVFMSLQVAGWNGYAAMIREKIRLTHRLRDELVAKGWEVKNQTPLPIVCFSHPDLATAAQLDAIAKTVVDSGAAWLSTTKLDSDTPVLRACITHFRTDESDILDLVTALEAARLG